MPRLKAHPSTKTYNSSRDMFYLCWPYTPVPIVGDTRRRRTRNLPGPGHRVCLRLWLVLVVAVVLPPRRYFFVCRRFGGDRGLVGLARAVPAALFLLAHLCSRLYTQADRWVEAVATYSACLNKREIYRVLVPCWVGERFQPTPREKRHGRFIWRVRSASPLPARVSSKTGLGFVPG